LLHLDLRDLVHAFNYLRSFHTHRFQGAPRKITPHVAQNETRKGGSALDERTTRHAGYKVSQIKRKLVEEIFGWMKTVGGMRKTRYKGKARTQLWAYIVGASYNLLRMAKLCPSTA
jgi:hypothetical protein